MRYFSNILLLAFATLLLTNAWAQEPETPPADTNPPSDQSQGPVPAYGQDSTAPAVTDNPPLSGLDLPSLEPHAAPLSYIQPGATVSETADTNVANEPGTNSVRSVTRALGTLALHRLWSHYDFGLDYVGGVGYYNVKGEGFKNLQQAEIDQRINWKRGSFALRDSFSYLPDGNFGGAYGALGSEGSSSLGTTAFGSFWGGSALGALGLEPRITNLTLADLEESVSPKSAVTVIGGYAFTHFFNSDAAGESFIGSSQGSFQGAYNRILSSHTQVAVVYGYQGFTFSVEGTAFHTHVIEGLYGHRITGRMDLLLGAGPQFTFVDTQSAVCSNSTISVLSCEPSGDTLSTSTVKNTKIGAAVQARLRYQFPRTTFSFNYEQFQTSGSGIFAGAQSYIARLTASRPISRKWTGFVDIGFARNDRLQPLTVEQVLACNSQTSTSKNACPANDATSYNYGFIGGGVHHAFSRSVHGYLSYQFNELAFDNSYCLTNTACDRISNRQTLTIGLDWTPRPIRID
jgi:hypothetical protein